MEFELGEIIIDEEISLGEIELDIVEIKPELEDIEIIPTNEDQHFKSSEKYGFNNVTVKRVQGETLNVKSSTEEQSYTGLYDTINIEGIETEKLNVTPTKENQSFTGLYDEVNVKGIETEELNIIPSLTEQIEEGIFNKVTVAGDSELLPENIKKDVEIFGVVGTMEGMGEENAIIDSSKVPTNVSSTNSSLFHRMLTKVPNFDISGWTSTAYLFYNCQALEEIPLLDTSNITSMTYMFQLCKSIKTIPLINTQKTTNMSYMFSNCSVLEEIPQLNTSKVSTSNYMFTGCSKLTTIPELDFSLNKNTGSIFASCSNLTNLGGFKDLGKAYTQKTANFTSYKLDLSVSTKITHDSLMNVINNLYDLNLTYDVANGGTLYTQGLVLGSTNKAKLTAEEIAIATNKGWTVS